MWQKNFAICLQTCKSWFQTIEKDEINAEDCTDLVSELEDEASSDAYKTFSATWNSPQKRSFSHLQKAQAYQSEFYLSMNYETKRNLELTTTIRAKPKTWVIVLVLRRDANSDGWTTPQTMAWKPLVLEGAIQNAMR